MTGAGPKRVRVSPAAVKPQRRQKASAFGLATTTRRRLPAPPAARRPGSRGDQRPADAAAPARRLDEQPVQRGLVDAARGAFVPLWTSS